MKAINKLLILSFIVSCYALLVSAILWILGFGVLPDIGVFLFLIILILNVANVAGAIITAVIDKGEYVPYNWYDMSMLLYKLGMVPFFVFSICIWYYVFASSFGQDYFLQLVKLNVIITYIFFLPLSIQVIAKLYIYYKCMNIALGFFILHSILQLFLFIDVIDCIIVHRKLQKLVNLQIEQSQNA